MKLPTIEELLAIIGQPIELWEGNCSMVAARLAKHLGVKTARGHYCGPVSPSGYWGTRMGGGFIQHSWVVMPDARGVYHENTETIVDPTRWSFEAKKPYIWSKPDTERDYDEGGNRARERMLPRSVADVTGDPIHFELESVPCDHIAALCGASDYSEDYPLLYKEELHLLANRSPDKIEWFYVAEVYEGLIEAGFEGSIPLDNMQMVARRRKLKEAVDD